MNRNQSISIILLILTLISAVVSASYSATCDSAFCRIFEESTKEILELKSSIDQGVCIPQLGQKADQICNSALEKFSQQAPLPDEDKGKEAIYDKKVYIIDIIIYIILVIIFIIY
jgi:hypothetical protein